MVLVAARGEHAGKPRPAVVVQSDLFNATHPSVTLCLITSELRDAALFRLPLRPTKKNGLRKRSQIMVDKLFSAPRANVATTIGELGPAALERLDDALRLWLQL